jgi:hypothetical protein
MYPKSQFPWSFLLITHVSSCGTHLKSSKCCALVEHKAGTSQWAAHSTPSRSTDCPASNRNTMKHPCWVLGSHSVRTRFTLGSHSVHTVLFQNSNLFKDFNKFRLRLLPSTMPEPVCTPVDSLSTMFGMWCLLRGSKEANPTNWLVGSTCTYSAQEAAVENILIWLLAAKRLLT